MINPPKPFNQLNLSGMPNMSGTLAGWQQKLIFGTITETYENAEVIQTYTEIQFMGTWQPLELKKLMMKPENQRSLQWIQCHARTDVNLKNDDLIQFQGIQYRVQGQWNYLLNGFYEYHLVQDFTGRGPAKIEVP